MTASAPLKETPRKETSTVFDDNALRDFLTFKNIVYTEKNGIINLARNLSIPATFQTVNLTILRSVQNLYMPAATDILLENLHSFGEVMKAPKAEIIALPNAYKTGTIFADNATHIDLKSAEDIGGIHALQLQSLDIRSAKKCGDLHLGQKMLGTVQNGMHFADVACKGLHSYYDEQSEAYKIADYPILIKYQTTLGQMLSNLYKDDPRGADGLRNFVEKHGALINSL